MAVDEKKPFILIGQDVYDYDAAQKAKAAGGADAAAAQTAIDNMEKRGLAQGRQAQIRSDYNNQQAIAAEQEKQRRADIAASWKSPRDVAVLDPSIRYNQLNITSKANEWAETARRRQEAADAAAKETRDKHAQWSAGAMTALTWANENKDDPKAQAALSVALEDIGNSFAQEHGMTFDAKKGISVNPRNGELEATLTWTKEDGTQVSRTFSPSSLKKAHKGEMLDAVLRTHWSDMAQRVKDRYKGTELDQAKAAEIYANMKERATRLGLDIRRQDLQEALAMAGIAVPDGKGGFVVKNAAQAADDPYYGYGNQKDYNNAVSTEQGKIWAYWQSIGNPDKKTPQDAEEEARKLVQSRYINTAKQGGGSASQDDVAQSKDDAEVAFGLKDQNSGKTDAVRNDDEEAGKGAKLPGAGNNVQQQGVKPVEPRRDSTPVVKEASGKAPEKVAKSDALEKAGTLLGFVRNQGKLTDLESREAGLQEYGFNGDTTDATSEKASKVMGWADRINQALLNSRNGAGGVVGFPVPDRIDGVPQQFYTEYLKRLSLKPNTYAKTTDADKAMSVIDEMTYLRFKDIATSGDYQDGDPVYVNGKEYTYDHGEIDDHGKIVYSFRVDNTATADSEQPSAPATSQEQEQTKASVEQPEQTDSSETAAQTATTSQQTQTEEPSWKRWVRDTGPGAKVDVETTRENFRKAEERRAAERREARKTEFSKLGDDKLDEQFDVLYAEDMDDAGREEFLAAGTGNRGRWLVSDVNELEPYYKVVFDDNAREADKARARQKIATMTAFDLKSGYMTKDILKKLEKMMAKKYANGRKG